jgi:hypothetical protein
MADTVDDAAKICRNLEFGLKLKIIMGFLADEVLNEAANVPFHILRTRWAIKALARPDLELGKVCLVMSIVSGVELNSTDAQLITAMRTKINVFAGAFLEDAEAADGTPAQITIEETDHDANPATAPVVTKRTIFNRFRAKK